MSSQDLKELYENPFFHGFKTEEEAYNLCKANLEQSGKPNAGIFFLLETQDRVSLKIYCYEKNSEVPIWTLQDGQMEHILGIHTELVERRTPQDLSQIARGTIMDSINCPCRRKTDCCVRNLEEKIDQLRIPKSEKANMKKLIHIFPIFYLN